MTGIMMIDKEDVCIATEIFTEKPQDEKKKLLCTFVHILFYDILMCKWF